jgi:hypothetical protein
MKKNGSNTCVLGVMATSRTIYAALLEETPDGPRVVRQFRRFRHQATPELDFSSAIDGGRAEKANGEDFSIQFGNDAASDMFLSSEFDGRDKSGRSAHESQDPYTVVRTFELEMIDILAECAEAGYPDPRVAFCGSSAEVTTVELKVSNPRDKAASREKEPAGSKPARADRKAKQGKGSTRKEGHGNHLVELLRAQYDGPVDAERVAFLPMTPSEDGQPRVVALIPKANEPVANTVRILREEKKSPVPSWLLDTEVALYLGLARMAVLLGDKGFQGEEDPTQNLAFMPPSEPTDPDVPRKVLVVRVGDEDTLVMFIEDGVLQHYESLHTITAFDATETICSRVLLLQDEYGTGDVQQVLLLGDEREQSLIESFRLFFPDTRVHSLRRYIPRTDGEPPIRALLLAIVAGMRLMKDELMQGSFEKINLLPPNLLKKSFTVPVTWHVFALYGLTFVTVLFFVARYFSLEHDTDAYRYRLQQYPKEVIEADAKSLQTRIDSLEHLSQSYMHALDVLDSLLVGSDKWSRTMEKVATEAASVSGLWIEKWEPKEQELELTGNATGRQNVVALADRLGASILSLSFSEIREWPVFSFTMKLPVPEVLPEAAAYLREQVQISQADLSGTPPAQDKPAPARSRTAAPVKKTAAQD